MPISTGNYNAEGVNIMAFPAKTVDGETVMVTKETRANETTLLREVGEGGRLFEADPQFSQKLRELKEDAEEVAESALGMVSDNADRLSDKADEVAEVIESSDIPYVPEDVEEVAQDIAEEVSDMADQVSDIADDLLDKIDGDDDDDPVAA